MRPALRDRIVVAVVALAAAGFATSSDARAETPPPPGAEAAAIAPRAFAEISGGLRLSTSIGGEVATRCGAPCLKSQPMGLGARLRGGYEWSSRWGVALEVAYLRIEQSTTDRMASVEPGGRPAISGVVSDELRFHGVAAGGGASYRWGDRWPFTARLNAGVVVASASDDRRGRFRGDPTLGDFDFPGTERSASALFLYAAPEMRVGYRPARHLEVSLGLRADLFIGLAMPRFPNDPPVVVGSDRLAFREDRYVSAVLVVASPDVGMRVDF